MQGPSFLLDASGEFGKRHHVVPNNKCQPNEPYETNVVAGISYDVVTTVRSQSKGDAVLAAHPDVPKGKLSYAIVEDIARLDAFDQVGVWARQFQGW